MFKELILKITKAFYPNGRAFCIPVGSVIEKIHIALSNSENKAYSTNIGLLNSILPDNDEFSQEDATLWEIRLGLKVNTSLTLTLRKKHILYKLRYPGNKLPRNHYEWMQQVLQSLGFHVFVHENRFRSETLVNQQEIDNTSLLDTWLNLGQTHIKKGTVRVINSVVNPVIENTHYIIDYIHGRVKFLSNSGIILTSQDTYITFYWQSGVYFTKTLSDLGVTQLINQHGQSQCGQRNHNQHSANIIAKYIDSLKDNDFAMGNNDNLRASFFISSEVLPNSAHVDASKENELRELILKLKPVHTAGYLLINYI